MKKPNFQNLTHLANVNVTGGQILNIFNKPIGPPINCRCVLLPHEQPKIDENGCKIAAEFLLLDSSPRLRVPSKEEWLGIGYLERDDELKRTQKD